MVSKSLTWALSGADLYLLVPAALTAHLLPSSCDNSSLSFSHFLAQGSSLRFRDVLFFHVWAKICLYSRSNEPSSYLVTTLVLLVRDVHCALTVNARITSGRLVSVDWTRDASDADSFIIQSSGPFQKGAVPDRFSSQELKDALLQSGVHRGSSISKIKAGDKTSGNMMISLNEEEYVVSTHSDED